MSISTQNIIVNLNRFPCEASKLKETTKFTIPGIKNINNTIAVSNKIILYILLNFIPSTLS